MTTKKEVSSSFDSHSSLISSSTEDAFQGDMTSSMVRNRNRTLSSGSSSNMLRDGDSTSDIIPLDSPRAVNGSLVRMTRPTSPSSLLSNANDGSSSPTAGSPILEALFLNKDRLSTPSMMTPLRSLSYQSSSKRELLGIPKNCKRCLFVCLVVYVCVFFVELKII